MTALLIITSSILIMLAAAIWLYLKGYKKQAKQLRNWSYIFAIAYASLIIILSL